MSAENTPADLRRRCVIVRVSHEELRDALGLPAECQVVAVLQSASAHLAGFVEVGLRAPFLPAIPDNEGAPCGDVVMRRDCSSVGGRRFDHVRVNGAEWRPRKAAP